MSVGSVAEPAQVLYSLADAGGTGRDQAARVRRERTAEPGREGAREKLRTPELDDLDRISDRRERSS